jgi:hypothetical protein
MIVHVAGSRKKEVTEALLNPQVALRDGVGVPHNKLSAKSHSIAFSQHYAQG